MKVLRKCRDLWLWVAVVSPNTTDMAPVRLATPPTGRRPSIPPPWGDTSPGMQEYGTARDGPERNSQPVT